MSSRSSAATLDDLLRAAGRHRSSRSGASWPTPRTNCAPRSRAERTLLQVTLADPDASADTLAIDLRAAAGAGRTAGTPDRGAAHAGQQRARHRALGGVRSRRGRREGGPGRVGRKPSAEASSVDATFAALRWPVTRTSWRAWSPTSSTTPCVTTSTAARSTSRPRRWQAARSSRSSTRGRSVSPEDVERLFEPFRTAGADRTQSRTDTGSACRSSAPSPMPTARPSPSSRDPRVACGSRWTSQLQVRLPSRRKSGRKGPIVHIHELATERHGESLRVVAGGLQDRASRRPMGSPLRRLRICGRVEEEPVLRRARRGRPHCSGPAQPDQLQHRRTAGALHARRRASSPCLSRCFWIG